MILKNQHVAQNIVVFVWNVLKVLKTTVIFLESLETNKRCELFNLQTTPKTFKFSQLTAMQKS